MSFQRFFFLPAAEPEELKEFISCMKHTEHKANISSSAVCAWDTSFGHSREVSVAILSLQVSSKFALLQEGSKVWEK